MRADFDSGYKQLFAHPEMMRDLLCAFLPYPWAEKLDVSAFERINASYVGGAGAQRHDDMVWRLRIGGECIYVYLLLEFQSASDRWMALRMQVYVGLLYQDLVKRHKLGRSGRLPPVLPIVLYGGRRAWTASHSLSSLVLPAPEGLGWLQPEQQYLLIDHHRMPSRPLAARNLVAALFGLRRCRSKQAALELLRALGAWLSTEPNQPLRDSLSSWIVRCLRHKLEPIKSAETEVVIMKDKQFGSWEECILDEAMHGREEGKEEGRAEGREAGREEGRAQAVRALLLRLVARRTGGVPPDWEQRIAASSLRDMERWLEDLFDGAAPEALFGQP
ncbi:hypothetical protein ASC94_14135 [Massilia sp. Root418]|uniref:Rpn family recombination-promoting nuclease/putative transposase n=1 Tax=Massilia sp. Root418 TaxID=1736532 RepID=UPI0006F81BD4|nr:Rpn family recombination-promoting nuclease/putative transposase [Massilia sp. Root418]KQW93722.1 hypothetical protein ASC94_14135 [Massilia sp. Root418]